MPQALAGRSAGVIASVPPAATSPTIPKAPLVGPITSKPSQKQQNRLKFQARDARPSRHAESSALIDFIREGPPREPGDHRINRQVAPFRTTMDSDDLNALAPSLPEGSSETNGIRSVNTTTDSQTPLLNHEIKTVASNGPSVSIQKPAQIDGDDGMPKKTRRRIKDPYAIDDNDDELSDKPVPKQTQEESLIDFLRNTAPPANMTAQPVLSSPEQVKAALNRSPSVDKLKDLVRGNRSTNQTTSAQAASKARAESPHLTQMGSKLDSYRPTQATHAAHIERNRAKSRNEARNSVKGYGDTADLADYLRNTGPPPDQDTSPQLLAASEKQINGAAKQDGGLKKFFSMRGRNK